MNSPSEKSDPVSPAAPGAAGFSGRTCEFCGLAFKAEAVRSYSPTLDQEVTRSVSLVPSCTCAADRARTLFCKDCKWMADPESRVSDCEHEGAAKVDPVMGPEQLTCLSTRADSSLCGPAARWWEAL